MTITGWIAWNHYDAKYFIEWAIVAQNYGVLALYQNSEKVAYMPLTPMFFIVTYLAAKEAVSIASIIGLTYILHPIDVLRLILKIPIIASNIIVGYYIYRREGWDIAKLWFYGIPIWVVMWQYQFDPLMVMFMVLGVYYLLDKKLTKAGILIGMGAAFKYVPFLTLPFILKAIKNLRDKLMFLLAFILPLAVSVTPFLILDLRDVVEKTLGFHMKRYPQMLSLFNLPYVLTSYRYQGSPLINFVWIPLFIMTYILLLWKLNVDLKDKNSVFIAFAASTLIFIIFNKVSNPQYILWPYPFLIYFAGKWYTSKPYFKTVLISATLIALILYPVLMFLPAAAVDRTVYVEEDAEWVPARLVVLHSFDGKARFLISEILYYMEYFGGEVLNSLYLYFNVVGALLIIAYNLLLIYLLIRLTGLEHNKIKNFLCSLLSLREVKT